MAKVTIIPVKGFDVGIDKTNGRFLVRFRSGQQATPVISLAPEDAAELSAAIVQRLSKLVSKH